MVGGRLLTLTEPSAGTWWVANAPNTILWIGSLPPQFSIFLTHPSRAILTGKVALVDIQPLNEYSRIVTITGLTPAMGYVLELTNIYKTSHVYVKSRPFEIRAAGSRHYHPLSPHSPSLTMTSSNPSSPNLGRNTSSMSISGSSTTSIASASISGHRISDGRESHFTFEYGGAYVAGLLATGLLCEGFRETSLKEMEEGTADGWLKLGPTKPAGKKTFIVPAEPGTAGLGLGDVPLGVPLVALVPPPKEGDVEGGGGGGGTEEEEALKTMGNMSGTASLKRRRGSTVRRGSNSSWGSSGH